MKELTKVEIVLKLEDGEMPKELVGMRFGDVVKKVFEKNNEIIKKIKLITGESVYTPYVDKFLTLDEKTYLTMGQAFKKVVNGEIK